jgi:hypothetical protein
MNRETGMTHGHHPDGHRALAAAAALCCTLLAACASGTAPPAASLERTVTVTAAAPVEVPGEPLRLQVVAVNDQRCPADVRCAWAGHASVALQVVHGASSPQVVLLGTAAPPAMNLPGEGRLGGYRLRLVELSPANTTVDKPNLLQYRAVIQVSRTSGGQGGGVGSPGVSRLEPGEPIVTSLVCVAPRAH